jgi:hypothetical protein
MQAPPGIYSSEGTMTYMNSGTATRAAGEVKDHPALSWAARLGFLCYGLVYVLIGWLSAQLALGHPDQSASRKGALAALTQQPLGRTLLWVAVAGFAALVVWEACEVVVGHRQHDGLRRVAGCAGSVFKAVVFGSLAVTAAQVAAGSGGSGGSSEDGYTARALRLPLGPLLVGAVGVAIVGYGVYSAVKGLTDRWRKELDPEGRTGTIGSALAALARTGYVARGVAFGVVGALVVWAAVTQDPNRSGGLDDALATLRDAPAGPYLLLLVAFGLACFGVFNVAKAWHLRDA